MERSFALSVVIAENLFFSQRRYVIRWRAPHLFKFIAGHRVFCME